MFVRFLEDTAYEPSPTDSDRCYGQLRVRPSQITRFVSDSDGSNKREVKICGPMENYFRKGSTLDLNDEVARKFIEAGSAESIEFEGVEIVSTSKIFEIVGQFQ